MRNRIHFIFIAATLLLTSCVMSKKHQKTEVKEKLSINSVDSSDQSCIEDLNISLLDTSFHIPADSAQITGQHVETGDEACDTVWQETNVSAGKLKLKVKTRTRPNTKGKVTDFEAKAVKQVDTLHAKVLVINRHVDKKDKHLNKTSQQQDIEFKQDLTDSKTKFRPGGIVAGIAIILALVVIIIVLKKIPV